jgi:hypothetical protein
MSKAKEKKVEIDHELASRIDSFVGAVQRLAERLTDRSVKIRPDDFLDPRVWVSQTGKHLRFSIENHKPICKACKRPL